jgi:hypothetical protein
MESIAVSLADDPVLEVVMSANTVGELIRIEIGAAEGADPLAETQELALYSATAGGTGGTALTERIVRGSGTISGAASRNHTAPGAGLVEWYHTGFNWQVGWLYLPVPEERYVSVAGQQDAFGFYFPTAPDAATTFSATIVWGEIGA